MLYTILCYHSEKVVGGWTPAQDAVVMEKLAGIQKKLAQQGKLGPVVRLMPTRHCQHAAQGADACRV